MRAVTPELANSLLTYNPRTGELTWKARDASLFSTRKDCLAWNNRFAGKPAFCYKDSNGYAVGSVFGEKYSAHRIIWLMAHEEWPDGHIDHINHNRSDNRMHNLRVVTQCENGRNLCKAKNNSSGVTGVPWCKRSRRWKPQITVDGKKIYLGTFTDLSEAVRARKEAEKEYGFHENHGK